MRFFTDRAPTPPATPDAEPWPWLEGPSAGADGGARDAFRAFAASEGLAERPEEPPDGILVDFDALGSVGFAPGAVAPAVRRYCLTTLIRPGRALSRRAREQLGPPVGLPWLDVADPGDGERWSLVDPRSETVRGVCWRGAGAARLFRLGAVPETDGFVLAAETPFSGGFWRTVYEPRVAADGALELAAPGGRFGGAGCYAVFPASRRRPRTARLLRWSEHVWLRPEGDDGVTIDRQRALVGIRYARTRFRVPPVAET